MRTTVHKVSERFTNSELYIIGTTNSSTLLANRTRRLIDELKPDTVFIQTSPEWWNAARHLNYVKCQEEMDKANKGSLLALGGLPKSLKTSPSISMLKFQFMNVWMKFVLGFPVEFNPFTPGLEMKFALEEAEKINSKVVFLGNEFDLNTEQRFHHEKRHTLLKAIYSFFTLNKTYAYEIGNLNSILNEYGVKKYVESTLDSKNMAYLIAVLDKIYPEVKRILVDARDEEIFKQIVANKGKRMVAVVNQHHMEGIEHHWCNSFGQVPTFNKNYQGKINPIGDMDLRKMLYDKMYHVIMRDIKSSRSRSSPASFTNEINVYHREFNHQYEHRNM